MRRADLEEWQRADDVIAFLVVACKLPWEKQGAWTPEKIESVYRFLLAAIIADDYVHQPSR